MTDNSDLCPREATAEMIYIPEPCWWCDDALWGCPHCCDDAHRTSENHDG